MGVAQFEEH